MADAGRRGGRTGALPHFGASVAPGATYELSVPVARQASWSPSAELHLLVSAKLKARCATELEPKGLEVAWDQWPLYLAELESTKAAKRHDCA